MKVAFLHAVADHKFKYSDINHDFVHMMLESVRRTMPNTDIIHMTDSETPPIPGTITNRLKWEHPNPMIFKMNHMMCLEGDVIILDTDVIVQKDIRPVFNFEFDMALTWRDGPIMTAEGDDLAKTMPYNCGVMFQRSRLFWKRCLEHWFGKNPGWFADQMAVAAVAPQFNVLRLHCDNFNYTPRSPDEDLSRRYVVHYKGERKTWAIKK